MKKKNHYIIISTLTLAVTLLSCSNLLDKTPVQKGQITITLNTPGRTVSPAAAVDITAITEWNVTVTQNETKVLKEKLSAHNGSISMQLPAGTYTFSVEGTAAGTDGNSDVTFTGSAENVAVNSQTASVSIFVYPKKTENGEGTFFYTITMAVEISGDGITAALVPTADPDTSISIGNIDVLGGGMKITLEASSVPSGFYLLSVTYYEQILPLGDTLIEICDGAATTGSTDNVLVVDDVKYVSAAGTGDGSRPWLAGTIANFVRAATDGDQIDLIYVDETVPPVAFTDRDTDGTVIIWLDPNNDSSEYYNCELSVSSGQGTKTLSITAAHLAAQGGITVAKGNQIELLDETALSDGETIVLTLDETSPPDVEDTIISNCTEEIAQRFLVGDGSKYKISSSGTLISAESPYAAWDQQKVLYVANTAADLLSASFPVGAMTDFCFDWDNNIYMCTSNQDIIKIPQGETYTEATPMPITVPTNTVSIACDNGNLYVLECSAEQSPTVPLWKYACADSGGTETSVSGTSIGLSASGLDPSVHKPVIAAADSTIYLAAPYTADNTWKVSAWTINDDETATEKYSIDLLRSTGLTAVDTVDTSDDIGATSVDWSTFRVSDLLVQDGAVYALLREVTDEFITSSPNTSRGAVVKLTDTGSALSVDTSFGSNGLLGWTAAPQRLPYGDATANTTVDCYWPASDNTNGFYGPAKFVAVKPKKLVIADDGATGSPDTSTSSGMINQKNRIIEVDLLNEQFTDIHLFEKETIEFDFAGWGSSSWTGVR